MHLLRRVFSLFSCLALLTACQGGATSPADQTATADAEALAQAVATAYSLAVTATAVQAVTDAAPTASPTITPTPDPFPSPIIGSIYVAEQRFESGWMFWLQPNSQIWVLSVAEDGQNIWSVYDDAFADGDAESDPQILPPEGRFQPIRGFGKLWRENPEIRQAIGWALDAELGHTTTYEYHHGGFVNDFNSYVPEPGYHLVTSLNGDQFRFNEESFTWSINN
ncbi:MAG: hypothetical protein OXI34_10560 [Chloroflexota bacterium]|nr:hypothetical protein [Chloroflexota bacterium]MDE2948154.1 hypothetical protein [Chloroflexota bacterium]